GHVHVCRRGVGDRWHQPIVRSKDAFRFPLGYLWRICMLVLFDCLFGEYFSQFILSHSTP
ncbi:hypothetical protein, partial [Pseudomonas sp. NBRC 111126]|uniref:hypothetical protein n=1 Tax=Pseudomonas sp. NBRC 111126 TaxID=1661041 RepID=UPI001C40648A